MSRPALAITLLIEGAIQAQVMGTPAQSHRRKSRSEMVHSHSLPSTQPATKIGQMVWLWAEIEAGLAAGMKLKEVWEAANRDGLEMSYAQFHVYISRIRRHRQPPTAVSPQLPLKVTDCEPSPPAPPLHDPFRNLREQREKKKQSGFEYDPFSINKSLID
ncbi:MAG: hypothetical protein ACLQKA_13550 [Bryobacteraceae bacterium]